MEEDDPPADEEKMEEDEEENKSDAPLAAAAVTVAAAAAAGAVAVHEIQKDEPDEEPKDPEKEEEATEEPMAEEPSEDVPAPEEETPAEEQTEEAMETPAEETPEEPNAEEPETNAEETAEEEQKEDITEPEETAAAPEEVTDPVPDEAAVPEENATEPTPPEEVDETEDENLQRLEDEVEPDDEDDEDAIHTINPDEETDAAITTEHSGTRDDRGQSVLHFAAARPGGASTILAFLQNPSVNLSWRDEKLRTARDVAEELKRTDNAQTIDSWIVSLVMTGEQETLEKLMIDGYTNILSVQDSSGAHIVEVAEKANHRSIAIFLRSIPDFQEKLLKLHRVTRLGSLEQVKEILQADGKLAQAMSPWGRCVLHTAVLVEQHAIVQYVAQTFPECLKRGDNLERTALHYAMGIEKVEKMTRILVRAGAKRVVKDLRGRQPSYYFINREEIALLQREEEQLKLANA